MSLRNGEAWDYVRLKEKIESRPTNSNAVYSKGETRPVFIYSLSGKDTFVVEGDDYKFYPAKSLPGRVWVTWEITPEVIAEREAEAAKTAEPQKPRNFRELQQQAQQQARNTMADRYQQNKDTAVEHSNVNRTVQLFADAAKREREAVAARMRPGR